MAEKREVRGEFQIESACELCGARFMAEARDDVGGQPDEHLVKVLQADCPACTELGCKPPRCPTAACHGQLRGQDNGAFECDACDTPFLSYSLRSLLFGRACEEIVREANEQNFGRPAWGRPSWDNLIVRKARELGVIP